MAELENNDERRLQYLFSLDYLHPLLLLYSCPTARHQNEVRLLPTLQHESADEFRNIGEDQTEVPELHNANFIRKRQKSTEKCDESRQRTHR